MGTTRKDRPSNGGTERFATLPFELREKVLLLLPDLPALQRLIYASDICEATFEQNAVKIVNTIMSGLTLELRQLIRAVAVALTGYTDVPLIDGDLFTNHGLASEDGSHHVDEKFGTSTLPPTIPLPSIRKSLLVSCLILGRGNHFLETHIDRLHRIEAEHLCDEKYKFTFGLQLKDYPSGISFSPQQTGSASWIERYRVECALWRLQLLFIFDEHYAGVHQVRGYETATIVERDITRMRLAWTYWEKDQMQAVHRHLSQRGMDFRHTIIEIASASSNVPTNQPLLDKAPTDEGARAWEQDRWAARRPTRARGFFDNCFLFTHTPMNRGVDWTVFHGLGFGFWDLRRMCEMELLSDKLPVVEPLVHANHPGDDRRALREGVGIRINTSDEGFFTWMRIKLDGKSILSDGGSRYAGPYTPQY